MRVNVYRKYLSDLTNHFAENGEPKELCIYFKIAFTILYFYIYFIIYIILYIFLYYLFIYIYI